MTASYEPERTAAMVAEFDQTAERLAITVDMPSAKLVAAILDSSATWCGESGCRAIGPFGAFIAGATSEPDQPESGFDLVADLLSEP